jgi:hypothetical protein
VDVVQLYAAADRETLHALSRVGHLVAHERQVLCADDDLPVEHPSRDRPGCVRHRQGDRR